MDARGQRHRTILQDIAERAMLERGLSPEFSSAAMEEVGHLTKAATPDRHLVRDLQNLLWASIDNDDSRDLDQLTVAEALRGGTVRISVAIADVDSLVTDGSAIDQHARQNTTSVYTAARIFPMIPEKLSTGLTSLNLAEERLAMVVEMVIKPDGSLKESSISRALVRNRAKLAYNSVANWLDFDSDPPDALASVPGLAENLKLQDRVAQNMKKFRHLQGSLTLQTIEAKPVFDGDQMRGLEIQEKNRAKELIEDFMIGANGVTARYLASRNFASIRRVVRVPKRWERIVEIAAERNYRLPDQPDSKALEEFLVIARAADPLRFPDLSLAVIKLLGSGEYIAELPGEPASGHFGLAVKDYTHSTAPNRRYPDLITQRLLKAALNGRPTPYDRDDLEALAAHCTEAEDAATKVERQVEKSAAALLLQSRIGEKFDSIVTGASEKGTWVRLIEMPVEGKVVSGSESADVGDRMRVQLIDTNVELGFIDFKRIGSPQA
ncbi:MAG TPA: RNB domain-containing ribonuclease [Anaerolineales bacterium]|jgi:exoribonuclease-2